VRLTDALLGEHGAFYAQFDRLEALPAGLTVAEVREQAALLASALVSHADLEDELLFERMRSAGGDGGLLDAMEEEHRIIAGHLQRAQGSGDASKAMDALLEGVAVAREHFAREERMAFPLAERLLPGQALSDLGAEWSRRRGVELSEG